MHSCIYEGRIRHRRFTPVENLFSYRLFMMYLDLAELPHLFDRHRLWSSERGSLAHFRRRDHLGDPDTPLEESVREHVRQHTGTRPQGPIRLLTHLRYFGYRFNPVSFFFCFDGEDRQVETIVAEITNTPWGEQHLYVLAEDLNSGQGAKKRYAFDKNFHVSPFFDMDQVYEWHFKVATDSVDVSMTNYENGCAVFHVSLAMERKSLGSRSLAAALVQYPLQPLRMHLAIYLHAARLLIKRVTFFTHPKKRIPAERAS